MGVSRQFGSGSPRNARLKFSREHACNSLARSPRASKLVPDAHAHRTLTIARRRREVVDGGHRCGAGRIGSRSLLIDTDQINVRAFGQIIIRTDRALPVLRARIDAGGRIHVAAPSCNRMPLRVAMQV